MNYIPVLDVTDLPSGSQKLVKVNNVPVVLFNFDGEISALGNTCLHQGGPLVQGKVAKKYDGVYVTCPWHGWEYNLKTGKAPPGYEDQTARYEVKVEGGKILVSDAPVVKGKRAVHTNESLKDLSQLQYQTTPTSLNILGISSTNMNDDLPRSSTSELALEKCLALAEKEHGAHTKLLKLRELQFKNCEGYYSQSEKACTWPCSISEMLPKDGMNEVYRQLVLWADILLVATPIRWGNASSLYYKMVERLNCVQNQITLYDKILIKNKVAGFIVTGGQDNIQSVAAQMMVFFTQIGFALPPFAFLGWSRGWLSEDMEQNVVDFKKSKYIDRAGKDLVDNCVRLLQQIKAKPCTDMKAPLPRISESPSKSKAG